MEQCLEEAGRLLQTEVDKQLGKGDGNRPKEGSTMKPASPPPAPAFDDDDPDGMMAAFFAKQQATKEASEKLPVEEWARVIVANIANEDSMDLEPAGRNDATSSADNKHMIDELWKKFSILQES